MKHLSFCIISILISIEVEAQNLESIVRFGDSLAIRGDYTMALNEYQRAFFFGENTHKCQLGAKLGNCYFVLRDYKKARSSYDSAICYTDKKDLQIDFQFKKVLCYMMEDNFGYALLKLKDLDVPASTKLYRKKNLYQGICMFGQEQYNDAYPYFMNAIPGTDTLRRVQLDELFERSKILKRPRSSTAMMMSIVVPGSGQIYTGEVKDGLNSLVLLSGLAYLGLTSPSISPLVIVPFFFKYYSGGIINAKESAAKKRERKQYAYYADLMEIVYQ